MESEYHHKVLVVDDDEQVEKIIDRILQKKKLRLFLLTVVNQHWTK